MSSDEIFVKKQKPAYKPRPNPTCCGALTFRKNREKNTCEVLLVQQSVFFDSWSVPKGHMEDGESFEECAIREVYEETGVPIKLVKQFKPFVVESYREFKTLRFWTAEPLSDVEPNAQADEASEVYAAAWHDIKWLPYITKPQRKIIKEMIADYVGLNDKKMTEEELAAKSVVETFDAIEKIYGDKNDNIKWTVFKKQLLQFAGPSLLKHFSRRHKTTKKMTINDFEKRIMIEWTKFSGRKVILNTEDMHNEEEYQAKREKWIANCAAGVYKVCRPPHKRR